MAWCKKSSKQERKFSPTYGIKPLSEKFYARHDNIDLISKSLTRYPYFAEKIEKRLRYDVRNRYYAPVTTNQTYGWLERFAETYTGLDHEILMHHIAFDEVMNVEKKIAIDVHREKQLMKL